MRYLITVLLSLCLLTGCSSPPPDPVTEALSPEAVGRGRLLAHGLAACGYCHGANRLPNDPLTGGRDFYDMYGSVTAANLTAIPDGIASWKTSDIVRAVRGAIRPDESELSYEAHRGYEWMSDKDLLAIVSYLRTLPAQGQLTPRRDPSFIERNTTGFLTKRREVKGYVPSINKNFTTEYGQYLTDNVARCSHCHSLPAGFFNDSDYMAGGLTVRNEKGEKVAPALKNSVVFGIGDWTESGIVNYLKTGARPDGSLVDTDFCPVKFFAIADESDLRAIARYLKSDWGS